MNCWMPARKPRRSLLYSTDRARPFMLCCNGGTENRRDWAEGSAMKPYRHIVSAKPFRY